MRSLTQLTRAVVASLVLAIALSASFTASAQQTIFDAVNDFSIESSTGVWSYGYTANNSSQFVNYTHPHVNAHPGGLDVWNMTANNPHPQCVVHNTTGAQVDNSTVRHPADMLNLHPGPNGESSIVRWTAQAAGMYEVKGRFKNLDIWNATTIVAVTHNSADPIASGIINQATQEVRFTMYVQVEAGETISFSVNPNGGYSNDSTGLAATIKLVGVYGQVTDECGNGLANTEIRLQNGTYGETTITDENGRYCFAKPSFGIRYTVSAQLSAKELGRYQYVPQSYTFKVMNDPQTANFVRTPVECPPNTICLDEPPCPL